MSQKSSVMQLPQFVPKALTSDIDYNLNRPHTSLEGLTPYEFATRSEWTKQRTERTYKWGHNGGKVNGRF